MTTEPVNFNPLFDPTPGDQMHQGGLPFNQEPEYQPGTEIELSEIDAEKALEFAVNAAAGGQQHTVAGMFQAATVIQNQANLWMQLHDRLLVKEATQALNSAFGISKMTNRDLIAEVLNRARLSDLRDLRSRMTEVLSYGDPEELDWAPE